MRPAEKFLSEETLTLHNAYLETLKAKYSVLEKCYPNIKGKDFSEILRIRESKIAEDKKRILRLKAEILCHEIYFASFGAKYQTSALIRQKYKNESAFLYTLYKECLNSEGKYIVISADRGAVIIKPIYDYLDILKISRPILAIDLCEHAYFEDYRFDREAYIERAVGHINMKSFDCGKL